VPPWRRSEAGRKAGGRSSGVAGGGAFSDRRSKTALRGRTNREDTAAIREWAPGHGHKVNDRGRISKSVLEA
jgi:hypothetical protein